MKGGNAFDAGVAALLVGGVVEQDLYSLGGEGLVLVYPQRERQGHLDRRARVGAARARPSSGTPARGKNLDGSGLDPAVVPGVAARGAHRARAMGDDDASSRCRRGRSNTRSGGSRCGRGRRAPIEGNLKFFQAWPDNQRILAEARWLDVQGRATRSSCRTLARTLTRDGRGRTQGEAKKGRAAGIVAARDRFYKGDIAREMVAFLKEHQAPFELDDFAEYFAKDRSRRR